MSIHIVTHAYAKDLPQYGAFLRTQLSSLLIFPPTIPIEVTVCCTPQDKTVIDVLEEFRHSHGMGDCLRVDLHAPEDLFRRAIGRNEAALATAADLVWFADVDHFFGDGCLGSLWDTWSRLEEKPNLLWPKSLHISRDHATGDKFWQEWVSWHAPKLPDTDDFIIKNYHKAIGGVQIVDGDYCREYGYLNKNKKWLRGNEKPFGDFRDDVKFRKDCLGRGVGIEIDIPELYRLRHSKKTYR